MFLLQQCKVLKWLHYGITKFRLFVRVLVLAFLQITVLIPRHRSNSDVEYNVGSAGQISMWPGSLGMAATFDPAVVKQFGQIAAKEYRALGITTALSPQIDLATEPRWARVNGTFGENPQLTADMARAYVDGFPDISRR